MKKLSIIISNRNDLAMLSVTVRSCIEELRPLGLKNCEIIIVDNSNENFYKLLPSVIPTGYIKERLIKIYHQDFPCLFTARDLAVEKSLGQYISCVDSHMIIGRNMFLDLYNFMEKNKHNTKLAFAHAPISWAHQHERSAKHDRDMSVNELGNWNTCYNKVRTITWKGMPWICRKSLWQTINGYGALSQHKLSWGGGDMHIGIKPWLLGLKNYAVPTNPGIHIGPFPKIDLDSNDSSKTKVGNYRLWNKSGEGPATLGFLVSCYVLGGEEMMLRNKSAIQERFGKYLDINKHWSQAISFGQDEKAWIDDRKVITFEQLLKAQPWEV